MKTGLLSLLVILCCNLALAQEKIIFLNGKEKQVGKVLGLKNKNLVYLAFKDSSEKRVTVNKVFSSVDKMGKENVFYRQDSAVEYELTPHQMRLYIQGEQEAMKSYKSPGSFYTGVAFGIAGGLLIPFFSPLALIPPSAGAMIVNLSSPEADKEKISNVSLLQSQEFMSGYQYKARTIKLKNSLLGGAAGLAGTLAVLIITGTIK